MLVNNKIMLVEDDDNCSYLIKVFLEECSFDVDVVNTVTSAISNTKFFDYSLILLDINLPDYNGFEVLKYLNTHKNIPIIILSAYSDKKTKLTAFKLGARDYMVKPIDPDELEARIWVQLKQISNIIEIKNKEIFQIQSDTILFNYKVLKLTKIEFDILKYLIINKNIIIKRKDLIKFLSSQIQSHRSLDYHIKNIRIKIGDNGSNSKYIITEYGVGYKLLC